MRSMPSRHLFAALVACLACVACSRAKPLPNVVVIVMDTARPDYLSVYGHEKPTTPFLERFGREATRFDRAYSTSSWTLPAHASLFSGTLPHEHGAVQTNPRIEPELTLLHEHLARAGYDTAGVSENVWISDATGLARGFGEFHGKEEIGAERRGGAEVPPALTAVESWLASGRDESKPFYLFVNLTAPHMPYTPSFEDAKPFVPSRAAYESARATLFPRNSPKFTTVRHYERRSPLSGDEWRALRALYEGDLVECDRLVERIVALVDAASPPDETLVFVLSDHGENLGDHDHVSHVFNVYDSNLKIALIARGPGFAKGAVNDRLAQITDVYATVLRAAGLEPEKGLGLFDLRGELPQERLLGASLDFPKLSLETFPEATRAAGGPLDPYKRELEAAISARWKVIRDETGRVEIYDLIADPNETRPLGADVAGEGVTSGLGAFLDVVRGKKTGRASELTDDPAMRAQLRALGYVE